MHQHRNFYAVSQAVNNCVTILGNPLYEKHEAEGDWRQLVESKLPRLKKLDGMCDKLLFTFSCVIVLVTYIIINLIVNGKCRCDKNKGLNFASIILCIKMNELVYLQTAAIPLCNLIYF